MSKIFSIVPGGRDPDSDGWPAPAETRFCWFASAQPVDQRLPERSRCREFTAGQQDRLGRRVDDSLGDRSVQRLCHGAGASRTDTDGVVLGGGVDEPFGYVVGHEHPLVVRRRIEALLSEEILVVGIERNGEILTPKGKIEIQPGDIISLFSKTPLERESLEIFGTQ